MSLSHKGGPLSLGLLRKEKQALTCDEVTSTNLFESLAGSHSLKLGIRGDRLLLVDKTETDNSPLQHCVQGGKIIHKKIQNCTKTWQGEIVQSDRMEIEVGGVDAMADLVQGTTELTVGDGAGDAGEVEHEV